MIGANGGAGLAGGVDILCTTAHLFRPRRTDQENATLRLLTELNFRSVWIDTKNGPAAAVENGLYLRRSSWMRMYSVPPAARDEVVHHACGEALWVSTGVWALCLALASGAASVITAGISLDQGHEGMPWDEAPRGHRTEDQECLRLLKGRYEVSA